jgi:hypothetical protein
MLAVSLPRKGEPLRDWQAVVIGGGIINGISLTGAWPGERIKEILKGNADLTERWQRLLPAGATMADNEKVPAGTRYDALRILGVDTWERRGKQLAKYLGKGVNAELQMGAISGLGDMNVAQVGPLLVAGLAHFPAGNRKLALAALLRTEARAAVLIEGLEKGTVKAEWLGKEHIEALRKLKNEDLRKRAEKALRKGR